MLSFMSDRRVLAISAACITAAIFLFLLGTYPSWKAAVGNGLTWRPEPPVPSKTAPSKPPGGAQRDSAVPASSVGNVEAPKSVAAVKEAAPSPASTVTQAPDAAPSFDIVRVEPSGDSVVAARARAGAIVVLLDQGRPIARAQADSNGQVAFVPPTLAPGEHSLMLSLGEPDAPGSLSSQSVAVSVPAQARTAPMVALLQPDQPTKLLAGGTPTTASANQAAVPPVSVNAIDVEEMGSVFATGRATPGSQCRVYLNGSFVAGVKTGPDGTWALKIEHGMRPGHYAVRVDELASANGDVRARAEVPFDYPARARTNVSLLRPRKGQAALPVSPAPAPVALAAATQRPDTAVGRQASGANRAAVPPLTDSVVASAADMSPSANAAPATGVPTVVAQLLTTKVVHGDSLWRISRKILGHGRRYTQIYAANTTQIRDPRLIYPGQIFVMPQGAP